LPKEVKESNVKYSSKVEDQYFSEHFTVGFAHRHSTVRNCDYKQVILTPCVGSNASECRLMMEIEAVENLLKGLGDG
jgi:hypothetical protein|tara:strand:+ start:218 stop:448 length:231 start_codon:yes stop_codon:yes gene_type:complete